MTKRILIVDDEPNLAALLATSLEKLDRDYIFETASNGPEALIKIQQAAYDVLLTDYAMPGMSGLDLAQAVRQISPNTYVLLMTAHGTDQLRNQIGHVGLDGYIDKPFTVAEIRTIVTQAIEHTKTNETETDPYRAGTQALDRRVYDSLQTLRTNIGAWCVLLLSSGGYPIEKAGHTNTLDVSSIGALVAANFMAAAELAKLLGSGSVFKSSYHEGDDYNIYAYKVSDDLLLAVIFGPDTKPGLVWFYTKQTAAELVPLLPTRPQQITWVDNIEAFLEDEFDQLLDFK